MPDMLAVGTEERPALHIPARDAESPRPGHGHDRPRRVNLLRPGVYLGTEEAGDAGRMTREWVSAIKGRPGVHGAR